MSDREKTGDVESLTNDVARDSCPLDRPTQLRNLVLFASCTGLQYLAAPVLYVGITQASLCDRLGADTKLSNLPGTFYFAMTAVPALIAWLFPFVSCLKRTLVVCYSATAVMLAIMALVLATDLPDRVKIGVVILQGAVSGAAIPTAIALLWEVIGRGAAESRRGLALGLAFGAGPLLAVIGSIGQVSLLGGDVFGWSFSGLEYPWGFVLLFGMGAPAMAVAAALCGLFTVPEPETEAVREPIAKVAGLCVGLALGFTSLVLFFFAYDAIGLILLIGASLAVIHHFRDILTQRTLLLSTLVTILVYTGNTIPSNMNLYTPEVLGDISEKYAGLQNMLRFGFKVAAGFFLGWLLTRTNPKTGILTTAGIFILAQVWAIFATGQAYLIAFGIYGAGELIGVYAPNYMLSASRKSDYRRTMAFTTMLMVPAAPAGYMFGALVDWLEPTQGAPFAFRASFAVCAVIMLAGVILAVVALPARPQSSDSPNVNLPAPT